MSKYTLLIFMVYALAGDVGTITRRLASFPRPTPEELAYGHVCPPSQRDALLTRSVLALLAVEDLRLAAILVRSYLSEIKNVPGPTSGGWSNDELKARYLDKTDGMAPSHAIFCSMLVRICKKDTKTAPLFTWLVRNFGQELGTMYDPEAVRALVCHGLVPKADVEAVPVVLFLGVAV